MCIEIKLLLSDVSLLQINTSVLATSVCLLCFFFLRVQTQLAAVFSLLQKLGTIKHFRYKPDLLMIWFDSKLDMFSLIYLHCITVTKNIPGSLDYYHNKPTPVTSTCCSGKHLSSHTTILSAQQDNSSGEECHAQCPRLLGSNLSAICSTIQQKITKVCAHTRLLHPASSV